MTSINRVTDTAQVSSAFNDSDPLKGA